MTSASPEGQRKKWMTLQEAADYLSVTDRTMRRMIADGSIRAYRLARSNRLRLDRADVDASLEPIAGLRVTTRRAHD